MVNQDPRQQPDASDEKSYPISQTELAEYQQREAQLRLDAAVVAGWRQSLIERMGTPGTVERGPLKPHVVYGDTGRTTLTEEGLRPVITRHLIITDTPNLP